MTIRYSNGQVFEAVLLSQTDDSMRVALQHSDDVLELRQVSGTWITEECEPVWVDFAWTRQSSLDETSEEDCICSPELASRLLHVLFAGENEPRAKTPATGRASVLPVYQHVV